MSEQAGLPARKAALAVLESVLSRRRPFDQALARERSLGGLSEPDRGFARLLLSTCLRRLGEIDGLLDARLRKPLAGDAISVRHILRLGATQLVFLGTPPHAAVDTSVRLVRSAGFGGFAGLVNAVLRRIADTAPLAGPEAARTNTPDWLWRHWSTAYGAETASAIAMAHLAEPPLDLTPKQGVTVDPAALEATPLPTGSLRRANTAGLSDLPGFAEGNWWVQDAAAALPARLVGAGGGDIVVDLCAAPGGKTAQLAAGGASVLAVDRSETRIALLRENMERLRLPARAIVADAAEWRPDRLADAVLLDAPCTATGTIRRHPDIPHLKQPEDVVRMASIQTRLIDAAAEMLRPGGKLVYAVCSLQPEEGPEVVEGFLDRNRAFASSPVHPDEVAGIDSLVTPEGCLRTLPSHWPEFGGLDGFFAARLVRNEG